MTFEDESFFFVTISGWEEVRLLKIEQLNQHPHIGFDKVSPLSDEFTFEYFKQMIDEKPEVRKRNAKRFFISELGLRGTGNGVIRDIFFLAKIHPKREMSSLNKEERMVLYKATKDEL